MGSNWNPFADAPPQLGNETKNLGSVFFSVASNDLHDVKNIYYFIRVCDVTAWIPVGF